MKRNNKGLSLSGMLWHFYIVLKLENLRGSAGMVSKSISVKLGFTQMLRVFRVDTSNAYISISIFARQGPFSQVQSQIVELRGSYQFKDCPGKSMDSWHL